MKQHDHGSSNCASASRATRILIVLGHYLPGYKAGGPMRSIANLVELLGDEFSFSILTADRDLGDKMPYPALTPNVWQTVGKAQVIYLSPDQMALRPWAQHLQQAKYDLIYLNSFFAPQTLQTLALRRLGIIPRRPVVLAARGEFSPGALGLKSLKKRAYIQAALRLGIYNDINWHATSASEISDMQRSLAQFFPDFAQRTVLAPNLTAPLSTVSTEKLSLAKQTDSVRIVFLSRVARTKNLDFALDVLNGLDQSITFDIYGPREDPRYWEECEQIIQRLPSNVQVTYHGAITPEEVPGVLSNYHLFFLPTRGENFGHAIVEAWAAGLPVLISDQTPWRQLQEKGVGWDLPLSDSERFRAVLRQVIAMDQTEFSAWVIRAKQFAADLVKRQSHTDLQAYRELFETAIRGRSQRS